MARKNCAMCRDPLPSNATAKRRYCSVACRVGAHRLRQGSSRTTDRPENEPCESADDCSGAIAATAFTATMAGAVGAASTPTSDEVVTRESEWQEKYAALESANTRLREHLTEVCAEEFRLRQAHHADQNALLQAREEQAKTLALLAAAEAEAQQVRESRGELLLDCIALRIRLGRATEESDKFAHEHDELRRQLEQTTVLHGQLKAATEQIDILVARERESHQRQEQLSQRCKQLEARAKDTSTDKPARIGRFASALDLLEAYEEMAAENRGLKTALEEPDPDTARLTANIQHIAARLEASQTRNAQLNATCLALQKQLAQLGDANAQLRNQNTQLLSARSTLHSENVRLTFDNISLNSRKNQNETEVAHLKAVAKQRQRQLAERTAHLAQLPEHSGQARESRKNQRIAVTTTPAPSSLLTATGLLAASVAGGIALKGLAPSFEKRIAAAPTQESPALAYDETTIPKRLPPKP